MLSWKTTISILAFVRQPPGRPGRRAFAAILDRLATLRATALSPDLTAAIHPERLRRLCQRPFPPRPANDSPAGRQTHLARRLGEIEDAVKADALEDVRLSISPLKSVVPDEAVDALAPLYACLPQIRVTDLLADVDAWIGLTDCFTHVSTDRPHDDPRAILIAILADATNLRPCANGGRMRSRLPASARLARPLAPS